MSAPNVRSVLEYVPFFRGKLFAVHIAASLVNSEELVDALLDIDALQEVGVNLILIAEQDKGLDLYNRTRTCEMRSAYVEAPLSSGQLVHNRVAEILQRKQIPVVSSGMTGTFDTHSIQLAVTQHVSKYIALLGDGKVPTLNNAPIPAILESEVSLLKPNEIAHRGILDAAAYVCQLGIPRVHLLNGQQRGVLVDELFSEEGVGTMVHTDSYREIRGLTEEDIPELLSMIARSVVDAKLVDRTYEDILARMDNYHVLTLDGSIVGCVALYPYPQNKCAELGCLYIKHSHEGHGYGRALCQFIENKAIEANFDYIFAISQSAVIYFRDRLQYAELTRDILPDERRRVLEMSGRRSGVFGRSLH